MIFLIVFILSYFVSSATQIMKTSYHQYLTPGNNGCEMVPIGCKIAGVVYEYLHTTKQLSVFAV